jgi:spectinomycin phosphotransferase
VRDKPSGVGDAEVGDALAEGWGLEIALARYAPVGAGSYHWEVRAADGTRWFATVDDLDGKAWLGHTRAAVLDGLRAAMDAACALRERAGLRFVAAPIRSQNGPTVLPLGSRYAIAAFPFLPGTSGEFGADLPARQVAELAQMLAALHQVTPALARLPVARVGLPLRAELDNALSDLSQPWLGGPFAEPARALLAESASRVRGLLAVFDDMAAGVAAASESYVITHGEPHPGNVLWDGDGDGAMLIDWDTVGLAPPERDLWMIARGNLEELRSYADAIGRPVGTAVLAFYKLRWTLDDIAAYTVELRAPHQQPADAEHAVHALQSTIAALPI